MSYQVLARKWRPRNFEQMVGQPHVLRALVNALQDGRLHHAYLFTGTRGVGKTTVARILAKCLNCEAGVTAQPCGECSACREIDEGRFVDLIEVDAASRTKVEDTRELLDNVQYAPTRGRYKVYLIDEVHMLSGHSFNALLKTLEEPPPHVKFLLATTDPQKLPVTILSRCLQFNLKRMPPQLIAEHLQSILSQEGIAADSTALNQLALAADGSMRDALSLLDQAIAFGGGQVGDAEVRDMLGGISREHLHTIVAALADGDAEALMQAGERLAEQAPDYDGVLAELISLLHQLALAQLVPGALDSVFGDPQHIQALASRLSPEDVQLFYQIALVGRRDLPLAPDPKAGFEMIMLRMLAFRPAGEAGGGVGKKSSGASAPSPVHEPSAAPTLGAENRPVPAAPKAAPQPPVAAACDDWGAIVQALGLRAMALTLASNCALKYHRDGHVYLVLGKQHEGLRTKNAEQRLEKALGEYYGETIKLTIEIDQPQRETPAQAVQRGQEERQQAAEQAIETDRVTQALKETFGAEVVPGSIKPL